jgi:hypothetical protein
MDHRMHMHSRPHSLLSFYFRNPALDPCVGAREAKSINPWHIADTLHYRQDTGQGKVATATHRLGLKLGLRLGLGFRFDEWYRTVPPASMRHNMAHQHGYDMRISQIC